MRKILLIAGLGCAICSVGAGHLYLSRLENEIAGGTKVPILVAAKDVAAGTVLTQQLLAIRDVPEAYLDSRAVRAVDTKRAIGNRLSVGLKAQEALLWSDLSTFTDQGRMLASLVQSGLRAVEIESEVSTFNGLLRPGDRVDLLFTSGGEARDAKSTITLLQNLLVLSVGGTMERDPAGQKTGVARRGVTVSSTLAQAQVITQAKTRGQLALTLRNPDDVRVVEGLPETTDKELVEARTSASNEPGLAVRRDGAK